MPGTAAKLGIEHVFVLMLENRSFDHMLGFSKITGIDAETGLPTSINGLAGDEHNIDSRTGRSYQVSAGGDQQMPTDPHHEFGDILKQLCGKNAAYPPGGPYPNITLSGFVDSYIDSKGQDPAEIMKCYRPDQLPVLNALAKEFVVCDNWHASLPGPTWPNRMFAHAASSGGLDHSPTAAEIIDWETVSGFPFPKGTIFELLEKNDIQHQQYAGDLVPMVAALRGIHLDDIQHFGNFRADLAKGNYPYTYTFIEPSYDVLNDYKNGTSQHPLGNVTSGEAIIKAAYEAIRASSVWPRSLLIVTWDENGGFYDHAVPPPAVAPGDTAPNAEFNQAHFTFERYGPRVVGLVISPLIVRNLIDHRVYDHSSIPATLESLFGLAPLTERDKHANSVDTLVSLTAARDTPAVLPDPAYHGVAPPSFDLVSTPSAAGGITRPNDTVNEGNLPAVIHAAMKQDMKMNPGLKDEIVAKVAAIETRAHAQQYLAEVEARLRARNVGAAAGTGA